jgi:hypothetical protein
MGQLAAVGEHRFVIRRAGNSDIIRRAGPLGYAAAVVVSGFNTIGAIDFCAGKSPDLGNFQAYHISSCGFTGNALADHELHSVVGNDVKIYSHAEYLPIVVAGHGNDDARR